MTYEKPQSDEIPVHKILCRYGVVRCQEPLAKVGFLYFTLDGQECGRIVFAELDRDKREFHFNQTVLSFEESDNKTIRKAKQQIRDAICDRFHAVDATFDRKKR